MTLLHFTAYVCRMCNKIVPEYVFVLKVPQQVNIIDITITYISSIFHFTEKQDTASFSYEVKKINNNNINIHGIDAKLYPKQTIALREEIHFPNLG